VRGARLVPDGTEKLAHLLMVREPPGPMIGPKYEQIARFSTITREIGEPC
jgi:hypothetical protein